MTKTIDESTDSELTRTLPLDTLYSLLAVGDFINLPDRMDEMIRASVEHLYHTTSGCCVLIGSLPLGE